jgi:hypothetical protein
VSVLSHILGRFSRFRKLGERVLHRLSATSNCATKAGSRLIDRMSPRYTGLAEAGDTYDERCKEYERRQTMILWVGGGLGALLILIAGDLSATMLDRDGLRWIPAVVVTLLLVSGAALAQARLGFTGAERQLMRKRADTKAAASSALPAELREWPRRSESMWRAGFYLTVACGVIIAVGMWVAAL